MLGGKLGLEVRLGPGKMKTINNIFDKQRGRNRVRNLGIFSVYNELQGHQLD